MDLGSFGFFVISAVLIATAAATVESRRLVHYILFLFMFLVTVAALFIYLNAVFLGVAELIIYNGGIVLLLAIGISLMPEGVLQPGDKKYILIIPIIILGLLSVLLLNYNPNTINGGFDYSGFGLYFFQDYAIIIAVLGVTSVVSLLSAIYFISKEDRQ
jgi:NADH-quinone oxidoreductase subunit J